MDGNQVDATGIDHVVGNRNIVGAAGTPVELAIAAHAY